MIGSPVKPSPAPRATQATRARALAGQLAERCRELRQCGLDAAAAERQTFEELLSRDGSHPRDWPNIYQDFLHAYAPELRRTDGVYYTPAAVVGAQVRQVADLLQRCFGCRDAFADRNVLTVDPATGSGAYPLAVNDLLMELRSGADGCTPRLRLLEPMLGAGLIARGCGLPVEQRDALAEPLVLDAPIVVCLGNPPYARGRASDRTGGFVRFGTPTLKPLLDDFRDPDAGVHLKNLYNAYVYFWRWALWEVFEQRSGPGIISFVTAASYLRGPAFTGMRRKLRQVLDELWIVDLEGDHLAARRTDNVFPIRTPVAIALGVRYGPARPHHAAAIHCTRLTGSGADKLASLDRVASVGDLSWHDAPLGWTCAFVARATSAYASYPRLTDLFPWQVSGAQLKRAWPIAPTAQTLRERWERLLSLAPSEQAAAFRHTRDRDLDSSPADLRDRSARLTPLRELPRGAACIEPVRYAYRSFDRHWVLPDARLGDFMRPSLWRSAGPRQVFLTSLLTNVLGPGPAAVATALVPDLDHFRGSFGARAVIPLWCDAAAMLPNLASGVLEALADRFGYPVGPEMLLGYCYALLATRMYVERFAEELTTPGPRIPLTRDALLFERVAALGQEVLSLHTYARVVPGQARCLNPVGDGYPSHCSYDARHGILQVGDGVFGALSPRVWAYSVSGLPIVRSWLRHRLHPPRANGSALELVMPRAWTPGLTRELLELLWLLEGTLSLEPALDEVLDEVVSSSGGEQAWSAVRFEQIAQRFGWHRP